MSIIFVHSANGQIHEDGVDYYKEATTNYVYSHAPKGHPDSLFVGKANRIPPLEPFLSCWYSLDLTSTLSNAQQRLDNQKNITVAASLLAADLEVRRDEASIALKKAEKTYPMRGCVFQMKQEAYDDLVKNEKEAKVKKNEMVKVLAEIQREFDEVSLDMWMREEIANRKKNIEETYRTQLKNIETDECELDHL